MLPSSSHFFTMLIQKNKELLLFLFREKTEYHIWEDSILNKWNNWKMQQYNIPSGNFYWDRSDYGPSTGREWIL